MNTSSTSDVEPQTHRQCLEAWSRRSALFDIMIKTFELVRYGIGGPDMVNAIPHVDKMPFVPQNTRNDCAPFKLLIGKDSMFATYAYMVYTDDYELETYGPEEHPIKTAKAQRSSQIAEAQAKKDAFYQFLTDLRSHGSTVRVCRGLCVSVEPLNSIPGMKPPRVTTRYLAPEGVTDRAAHFSELPLSYPWNCFKYVHGRETYDSNSELKYALSLMKYYFMIKGLCDIPYTPFHYTGFRRWLVVLRCATTLVIKQHNKVLQTSGESAVAQLLGEFQNDVKVPQWYILEDKGETDEDDEQSDYSEDDEMEDRTFRSPQRGKGRTGHASQGQIASHRMKRRSSGIAPNAGDLPVIKRPKRRTSAHDISRVQEDTSITGNEEHESTSTSAVSQATSMLNSSVDQVVEEEEEELEHTSVEQLTQDEELEHASVDQVVKNKELEHTCVDQVVEDIEQENTFTASNVQSGKRLERALKRALEPLMEMDPSGKPPTVPIQEQSPGISMDTSVQTRIVAQNASSSSEITTTPDSTLANISDLDNPQLASTPSAVYKYDSAGPLEAPQTPSTSTELGTEKVTLDPKPPQFFLPFVKAKRRGEKLGKLWPRAEREAMEDEQRIKETDKLVLKATKEVEAAEAILTDAASQDAEAKKMVEEEKHKEADIQKNKQDITELLEEVERRKKMVHELEQQAKKECEEIEKNIEEVESKKRDGEQRKEAATKKLEEARKQKKLAEKNRKISAANLAWMRKEQEKVDQEKRKFANMMKSAFGDDWSGDKETK